MLFSQIYSLLFRIKFLIALLNGIMETIESGSLVVGNNFYAWALGN